MASLPYGGADRRDGVVGLAFAMRNVAPLLLDVRRPRSRAVDRRRRRRRRVARRRHRARRRTEAELSAEPTIFLYDNYPGGIGFSEPLFAMHDELLARTRELIDGCPCQSGCPSCVGPEGATGPLAKAVASHLLELLTSAARRPPDTRHARPRLAPARHRPARLTAEPRRRRRLARELTYVPDIGGQSHGRRRAAALGGTVADARTARLRRRRSRLGRGSSRMAAGASTTYALDAGRAARAVRSATAGRRRTGHRASCSSTSKPRASAAAPARCAFLAGCGWFEDDAVSRAPVLPDRPGRRARDARRARRRLRRARRCSSPSTAGRSTCRFMDMRWAFHRTASPTDDLPHFDMLPPARRLWGRRGLGDAPDASSCSLVVARALRARVPSRSATCPGFEIPSRYFQFLRTGDASCIEGVLEHNRHDLVSLAAIIVARAVAGAARAPRRAATAGEQIALGRLYERAGDRARAVRRVRAGGRVRRIATCGAHALARLAVLLRRDASGTTRRRRPGRACWTPARSTGARSTPLERRAAEALAIHHEHRARDLRRGEAVRGAAANEAADAAARTSHRLGRHRSEDRRPKTRRAADRPPPCSRHEAPRRRARTTTPARRPSSPSAPWRPCWPAACFLRPSVVCAPNRFVKRSTRPSVSISFWRPVKNGWHLLQISRCSSGLVEWVLNVLPARAPHFDFVVLRMNPRLHSALLGDKAKRKV